MYILSVEDEPYISPIKSICVIGGGPAGMMAAGTALSYGADVMIFEHMPYLGKKLGITGKGRCNVTNNCTVEDFLSNVTKNPRFLYSALGAFSPYDTLDFFERLGVKLKTERGNRVYPEDDRARTIVDAMRRYCKGAKIATEKVKSLKVQDDGSFIINGDAKYTFDSVILATGGRSYPLTGSDGSGHRLATKLGHSVTTLIPSLIPFNSPSKLCSDMQGLSLRNVAIKILDGQSRTIYSDFGEMMFTHFGVTGPIILSASAHVREYDISSLTLSIDLKPALDEKTLDARLLSDFRGNANKDFINALSALLPSKMIEPFIFVVGISPRKKVNTITKEERKRILTALKDFRIPLSSFRPIEEAIVTSGGVDTKEIRPGTMESKLVENLYFAGEVIDVDAYTGGFNLQIAFSTGYLAGKSAAEK